ncbi:MAG: ComEC/Rec2 family competence protein, partial [Rhodospirillales bacterium]
MGTGQAGHAIWNVMLVERPQWAHWLPVGIGIGIAIYFSLPTEPPSWLGGICTVAVLILYFLIRSDIGKLCVLVLITLSLGLAAAQWRTKSVKAPTIHERTGPVRIIGEIERLDLGEKRTRLILSSLNITGRDKDRTPGKIRLSFKGADDLINNLLPGTRVSVFAILRPPPPPSMPAAFDFQRHAFFQGIGAYGFILGPVEVIGDGANPDSQSLIRRIETLRLYISKRVHSLHGDASGAVAAALMTGHRSYIPEDVMQDMRDAGIAHLLAISGLHIGLVAGIVFATVRLLLALVPMIGLRIDAKKTAAWFAIPAALAYAVLAGLTVPTERAFLMTGLMLTGVLIDRRA